MYDGNSNLITECLIPNNEVQVKGKQLERLLKEINKNNMLIIGYQENKVCGCGFIYNNINNNNDGACKRWYVCNVSRPHIKYYAA
jgi:uncharacterized protein YunC (DUF1805 family)